MLGLQGAHKLLIFKAFFVVVYFAGVPLALLVPLLTGVICGLRMERVGRRWGTAIGAAVGIPASALALSWQGSPLALVRRISGPLPKVLDWRSLSFRRSSPSWVGSSSGGRVSFGRTGQESRVKPPPALTPH